MTASTRQPARSCIAYLSNPPLTQPLRPAEAAAPRCSPACRAAEEREGEEPRDAAPLPPEAPARNPRQPASHRWPQARTRRPPAAAMPTRPRRAVARAMVPSARRMPSAQQRRPSRTGAGGGGGGDDGALRTRAKFGHVLQFLVTHSKSCQYKRGELAHCSKLVFATRH